MHVDTLSMLFPDAFDQAAIRDGWVLVWIVPDESSGQVRELYIERADEEWAEALDVADVKPNPEIATDEDARAYVERMAAKGAHPHTLAIELVRKFEAENAAKERTA